MITYRFAKVTVRPYPNICDINNKWIFTPDIGVVIYNCSSGFLPPLEYVVKELKTLYAI